MTCRLAVHTDQTEIENLCLAATKWISANPSKYYLENLLFLASFENYVIIMKIFELERMDIWNVKKVVISFTQVGRNLWSSARYCSSAEYTVRAPDCVSTSSEIANVPKSSDRCPQSTQVNIVSIAFHSVCPVCMLYMRTDRIHSMT